MLLFFTNTVIFSEFVRWWEPEGKKIEEIEHYDVAIVLGGMAEYDNNLDRLSLRRGADRLWQAVHLYQLGKVDKLLISGDSGHMIDRGLNEALRFRDVLTDFGIPKEDILVDSLSKNTHQNALESKKVLEQYPDLNDVLLVTSALHMPRSKACFQKVGFNQIGTITTDHFTGRKRGYSFEQYLIPNISNLEDWKRFNHEWIGYLVYWIVGYV
jgi:uncharacterized SAM-binding protein YcdF (DUF218 family)